MSVVTVTRLALTLSEEISVYGLGLTAASVNRIKLKLHPSLASSF